MLHRRVKDEYPAYAKDGTFERAIEDPTASPKPLPAYLTPKKGSQPSHIIQLLKDEASAGKLALIKLWNHSDLEFRSLRAFRNALYGSKQLDSNNMIPMSEFVRLRSLNESQ